MTFEGLKGSLYKNFYLLGITAFPGIHKLITLLLITYLFDFKITGYYINDIFIIYIFGFFTVFNWATFILAEMPKLPIKRQSLFFAKIYWLSLTATLLLGILSFILYRFGLIINQAGFIILLVAWSYYQLWRHYFLGQKRYEILFFSDLIIFLGTLLCIYLSFIFKGDILIYQSFPLIIIPLLFNQFIENSPAFFYEFRAFKNIDIRVYKRAFNFTLINLSTGGVQLFLAPLSYQLLSAEVAAIVGLTNNFGAIAILIPRALSYNILPELPKFFRISTAQFIEEIDQFQKRINWVVISLSVLGALIQYIWLKNVGDNSNAIILLSILIYINLLTSQLALPYSNGLLISGNDSSLLKINITSLIIYTCLFFCFYSFITNAMYILLLITSMNVAINYGRYMFLQMVGSKKISYA